MWLKKDVLQKNVRNLALFLKCLDVDRIKGENAASVLIFSYSLYSCLLLSRGLALGPLWTPKNRVAQVSYEK
jgi:hypothetical protein